MTIEISAVQTDRQNQIILEQIEAIRVKRFWRFKRKLNKEERVIVGHYLELRQQRAKDYWHRRRESKGYIKEIKELLKPLCENPFVQSIDLLDSSFTVMKGRSNLVIIAHDKFKSFDDTPELYVNQEPKGIFNKWF